MKNRVGRKEEENLSWQNNHRDYTKDRDVHASKNVKLFGSTKRTEFISIILHEYGNCF